MSSRGWLRPTVLACVGLSLCGWIWLSWPASERGPEEVFSEWLTPNHPRLGFEDYRAELTNVVEVLPVALGALERSPSAWGQRWERVRNRLPDHLARRLSEYDGPRHSEACRWLAEHAAAPEVAAAVHQRWPVWPDHIKEAWLTWLNAEIGERSPSGQELTDLKQYLPELRSAIRSGNFSVASAAAYQWAQMRPWSGEQTRLLSGYLANVPRQTAERDWQDSLILQTLASDRSVPPEVEAALQTWLQTGNTRRGARAALVLASLDPIRFPPAETISPRLLQLSASDALRIFASLAQPEFRDLTASPWILDALREMLSREPGTNQVGVMTSYPSVALSMLSRLGRDGEPLLPWVTPLLASRDGQLAKSAAFAFASIAPPTSERVAQVAVLLTNRIVAAPLLLWLVSAGVEAKPAEGIIYSIANDTTRFPTEFYLISPVLAQRYGLSADVATAPAKSVRWVKPTDIRIAPDGDCPKGMLPFWPGFAEAEAEASVIRRDPDTNRRLSIIRNRLPTVSLAELARHCLTNLGSAPPRR